MYETRLSINYLYGTLTTVAALSDTTLSSADFATLPPGLSTTTYVPITLQDPATKTYEIVWATGHTAGASSITAVRSREASTGRQWPAGTLWTLAPTLRDGVLPVASRAQLPTDPHVGLRSYLQDEQLIVEWILGVGWVSTVASIGYRATRLLTVDTAAVTFSAIPSTLKQLTVVYVARTTWADFVAEAWLRVNNDAGALYFGNTQLQAAFAGPVSISGRAGATFATMGVMPAATASAAIWGTGEVVIQGWNNPNARLGVNLLYRSHMYDTQANSYYGQGGFMYYGSGPNTSITLTSAALYKAGSEFTVYGWA